MRYKTGTKKEVLRQMIVCACRDRHGMIDGWDHMEDEEAENVKQQCRDEIDDFLRLGRSMGLTLWREKP